ADVEGETVLVQIIDAPVSELVAADREFERADVTQELEIEVPVVRREDLVVLRELARDRVHLGRLVDRTADEEQLFAAFGHTPSVVRPQTGRASGKGPRSTESDCESSEPWGRRRPQTPADFVRSNSTNIAQPAATKTISLARLSATNAAPTVAASATP